MVFCVTYRQRSQDLNVCRIMLSNVAFLTVLDILLLFGDVAQTTQSIQNRIRAGGGGWEAICQDEGKVYSDMFPAGKRLVRAKKAGGRSGVSWANSCLFSHLQKSWNIRITLDDMPQAPVALLLFQEDVIVWQRASKPRRLHGLYSA